MEDINEIDRIFSMEFPLNNIDYIGLYNQEIWEESTPVKIPPNLFREKTARRLYLCIKISEIDPQIFINMASELEVIIVCGFGPENRNPIEEFPLYILDDLPNLIDLQFHMTQLSDQTFYWDNGKPSFSELVLPNIGNFEGKIT